MAYESIIVYRDTVQLTVSVAPGLSEYELTLVHLHGSVLVTRAGKLLKFQLSIPKDSDSCSTIHFEASPDQVTLVTWFALGVSWTPSYTLLVDGAGLESTFYATLANTLGHSLASTKVILANARRLPEQIGYGVALESTSYQPRESDQIGRLKLARRIDLSGQTTSIAVGSTQYAIDSGLDDHMGCEYYVVPAGKAGSVCARLGRLVKALNDCPAGSVTAYQRDELGTSWIGNDTLGELVTGELSVLSFSEVPISATVEVVDNKLENGHGKSTVFARLEVKEPSGCLVTHHNYNRHQVVPDSWEPAPTWMLKGKPVWAVKAKPDGKPFVFTYIRVDRR